MASPVILDNVPRRTVADMLPATLLRLSEVPGMVGVKAATGNIDRAAQLIRQTPAGFSIFSGDDPTAVALMRLSGHGTISVTANVTPGAMSERYHAALAGDA